MTWLLVSMAVLVVLLAACWVAFQDREDERVDAQLERLKRERIKRSRTADIHLPPREAK